MPQRFAVTACAIGALTLSTTWAATVFNASTAPSGAHYANGSVEPVCTVDQPTLTVSCTGTVIGGIGGTDADLRLSVSYSGTVQCKNRGGQIVDVKTQFLTTSGSNGDTRVKNGQLTVAPISVAGPSDGDFTTRATCPNGNWTKQLVDGSATITGYSYTLTFLGYQSSVISISG